MRGRPPKHEARKREEGPDSTGEDALRNQGHHGLYPMMTDSATENRPPAEALAQVGKGEKVE